jgi:hypothetical protein
MKKEIREYFEQMGYPTHELVNKNRRGLMGDYRKVRK